MGGIKWNLKESKNLFEGNYIKFTQNNNYIVFIKYDNINYYNDNKCQSILFEKKIKKEV